MSLVTIRPRTTKPPRDDRVIFRADAAASWVRAEAENGGPIPTNRTTVTWADQIAQQASTPGLAVSPEYSDHVHKPGTGKGGTAADLTNPTRHAPLLRRHGWEFTVKGEPWHGVYNPDNDPHRNAPEPGEPTETEEDEMRFAIMHNGNLYLANGTVKGGIIHLTPGMLDIISGGASQGNPGYWVLSNGKTLDDGIPTFDTKGNQAAFDQLTAIYGK